jgi:spore germination protein GerM
MRASTLRRILAVTALGAVVALAPACSDDDEPPASTGTTATATATTPTDGATATAPGEVTVYFSDAEGRLAAETREATPDLLGAMEALAAGPEDSDLIPALPAGTQVLSAEVDGTVARVDLSAEFETGYPPGGAAAELATVGPIVHTAAEIPGVESVAITVEGRVPMPSGTQLDFSTPLTPEDVPLDHPAP